VYAQASPSFKVSKTCLSECIDSTAATIFKDTITTSTATAWKWNFGDVGAGKNTSTLKTSAHLYASPGVKTVTLIRTVGGIAQPPIVQTVTINPPPQPFYLGNSPSQQDTTICKGDFLTLDPHKNGGADPKYKYIWFPKGDITQQLRADTTSCYSVQVTDSTTGCSAQNKINVKLCVPPPPKPPETYWYFGNNAGIKFSGSSATADTKGKIDTKEGVSTISDKNGNLLFYTDGLKIYDKNGNEIPSLVGNALLAGSNMSTESAVIVPQPSCQGCQSLYYVFTTSDINGKKQLSYSVVDIRQNKGLGKVIEKNTVLDDAPTTEQLISHFVKKDSTYWVITHDYGTNVIRLRRVTKNGVSISKTIKIGSAIDSTFKGEGYMKISKDGTKLAVAIPGGARNLIELYNFSDSTGAIANKKVIDLGPAPPTIYGIEFSPDSKTLFATMKADTIKKPGSYSSLLRFDITDKDSSVIAKSKITLDSSKKEYYGAIQLAPDGKIYVAIQGSKTLGIINLPNDTISTKSLTKKYYDRKGLDLGGKTSQLGLPTNYNENETKNEGVGISASDTCLGSPSSFKTNHLCGDKLKNTKTDWRFYKGAIPQDGKPVGSPVTSIQGGEGDKGLMVSYTFTEPGKYYVVVNMGNRCKSDTMLPPQPFEILPLPKPDLGSDINLCAKTTTLDSKVTLDSSHYFWFQDKKFLPKDSLRTLIVHKSGSYIVAVESRGCIGFDSVKVVLAQAKPLNLGPDTLICQGSPLVLDASNGAGTGTTYLWSTGATTAKITVTTAGRYIVNVTTLIGTIPCKTADTINVRIRPRVSFSITKNPPTGCTANDGAIKLLNFSPPDSYNFTWFKDGIMIVGATSNSITNLTSGSYKVTIKSILSCDTTVAILLNAATTPIANITLTPSPVTCISDGAINITVASNSQFRPVSFILRQRDDNDAIVSQGVMASIFVSTGNYTIKGLKVGTYYIEFKDNSGCKFISNDLKLNKIPRTDISLLPTPTGKCEGEKITLSPLNYTNGSIKWSTGATTLNIDVTQSGLYIVTITSTDGKCISSAKTNVLFNVSPKVSLTAPSRLCLTPNPTQLIGSPAGGIWQGTNVSNTGIFMASAIGIYAVKYKLTQNGCTGNSSKEITVLDTPVINLGPDKSICRGVTDSIGVTPVTGISYRWSSGENTSIISPESSGKYILTATKDICSATDTISVNILPVPYILLRDETPICIPANLPVKIDAGGGVGLTYLWNPTGQTTKQISVSSIGVYTVFVTNSVGCSTTAKTTVIDRCDPSILVPTIFTPNGDNNNDDFQVFPFYISDFDLKIYNRWGELIFTSKTPNDRWDGKYKGTLVKPDSFAWVITYIPEYFPQRGLQRKEGAVTVAW